MIRSQNIFKSVYFFINNQYLESTDISSGVHKGKWLNFRIALSNFAIGNIVPSTARDIKLYFSVR